MSTVENAATNTFPVIRKLQHDTQEMYIKDVGKTLTDFQGRFLTPNQEESNNRISAHGNEFFGPNSVLWIFIYGAI